MNHWVIVPVLLPLFTGLILLLGGRWPLAWQRRLGLAATAALVPVSFALLAAVGDGSYRIYALGDWPAPYGIVLVVDRLSALMLALTSVLALASLTYATRGSDRGGRSFHPLFQLQLLGLNGAFLTGDLFNLFVFFEILLIASYALLLFGGGAERARAGLHYVVLNLVGSSLFLIAVAVLYGVLGTLNMADLAVRVAGLAPADVALVRAAGLLLLLVFALKAALLPLYFWLPAAYASATAPAAALFAIMTKVGVYAIIRVYTLVFGQAAGSLAGLAAEWLLPLALATLLVGAVGALASQHLRRLVAYLVVVSVGTLLVGLGLGTTAGLAASLYYLLHTTLVTGGLFLLADLIGARRGPAGDSLEPGARLPRPLALGVLFFLGAVAAVGMPPLSGFLGKVLLLEAAWPSGHAAWVWGVVLSGGLLSLVTLSRAGSVVFWRRAAAAAEGEAMPVPGSNDRVALAAAAALLLASPVLVLLAAPLVELVQATASQLMDPAAYAGAVLGDTARAALGSAP